MKSQWHRKTFFCALKNSQSLYIIILFYEIIPCNHGCTVANRRSGSWDAENTFFIKKKFSSYFQSFSAYVFQKTIDQAFSSLSPGSRVLTQAAQGDTAEIFNTSQTNFLFFTFWLFHFNFHLICLGKLSFSFWFWSFPPKKF